MSAFSHKPVMPAECLAALKARPGGRWWDATVGLGGHSEEILKATAPDGVLFGTDRDAAALARAKERLAADKGRLRFEKANYAEGARLFAGTLFDGILADLGVSSLQLDDAERGFSFMRAGPLDMRMDRDDAMSAKDYLKGATAEELLERLEEAGEERFGRKLAVLLKEGVDGWETTADLAAAVARAIPRRGKSHPATRVFLALRMAVNRELESLREFLASAPGLLKPGGRLAVITFHSTEDRIVKRCYEERADMRKIGKSPLIPSWPERKGNPRSRSAKLRTYEKV